MRMSSSLTIPKKNLPADTYSYQFVECSVRNGKLEDLDAHRTGPFAPRPVGASHIPKKRTRTEYTLNDDQILYDWVYLYVQAGGQSIQGNKVYQELAQKFPQHPFQSWRHRYLKVVKDRPRPGGGQPRPDFLELVPATERPVHSTAGRSAAATVENPTQSTAARPEPSKAANVVRNSNPTRTPAEIKQSHASTKPHTRPNRSGESKRKRDSPTEKPRENQRDEMHTPSSKRVLIETSEAMDTLTQNLLESTRQTTRKSSLRQSTQRSPSRPLPSTELPTNTTQLHNNDASTTETQTPSPQLPKTPEPAQKAPPKQQESQDPQLDLPNPFFLELPFLPSSPEPEVEETDQESNLDVNDWIDAQLENGKVELSLVLEALQCTSMNPEYAQRVLEHCAAGKGIPTDMRGVWSAEDDRCLEAEDGRAVKAVYEKHGADLFNARWEYLRLARDGGIL